MPTRQTVKLASIGYEFDDARVTNFSYSSPQSLLDFDIVLWKPEPLDQEYSCESGSLADDYFRPCLRTDVSAQSQRDAERRRQELNALLEAGRTLVLFIPPPSTWFYHTGKQTYSGTGRNRQVTNLVQTADLFDLLPFEFSSAGGQGTEIELVADEPFASFWREWREWFGYEAYLDNPIGTRLLGIANTDKCVGCVASMGKGLTLFLPRIKPTDDEDERYDGTVDTVDAGESDQSDFIDALIDLVQALRGDLGDFAMPSWSHDYSLPHEAEALAGLDTLQAEASNLLERAGAAKKRIILLQQRKLLFSGSGEALRRTAQKAFEGIGFEAAEGAPGRTDILLESKEGVAVAEVKGLGKSAREKDAAQLEKWVSEYVAEHNTVPKAILVVNSCWSKPLSERTETDFPDQMLRYSEARKHCLVTGWQLLCAWLDADEDGRRKPAIRKSLLECVGRYDRYPSWNKYLSVKLANSPATEVKR